VSRNLVLKVFVTQQIMIHPPQAYSAISKMYKRRGKLTAHRRKSLHSLVSIWTAILKFGFIQCPDTDQLQRPHCVICAAVLRNEAMKSSRLIRHLNPKHSDLINKPTEFFMRKRDALKTEKKIDFPSFNHWHFTSDGILFNVITDS